MEVGVKEGELGRVTMVVIRRIRAMEIKSSKAMCDDKRWDQSIQEGWSTSHWKEKILQGGERNRQSRELPFSSSHISPDRRPPHPDPKSSSSSRTASRADK
ncbi:hypothetical protein HPP92_002999 [Vanilla planifolia]|uniref:Uncharacterized protein n=1 Tax=Vanilla planifolia TaxID=51239 RepID=A0A835VIH2_VANPL|nr:hypothetical protein HPP92_002999 [Vanilla planifolia]